MTLRLAPITTERFPAWLRRCRTEYEADLVRSGESPEQAQAHAAASLESAFPDGGPTADSAVFHVVASDDASSEVPSTNGDGTTDNDAEVGYLWVGRGTSGDPTAWWIWDIVINESHRGRGYGRTAMELAEEYALSRGAKTLGLSVFGFNKVAQGLYESLGYETTTVKMQKPLAH